MKEVEDADSELEHRRQRQRQQQQQQLLQQTKLNWYKGYKYIYERKVSVNSSLDLDFGSGLKEEPLFRPTKVLAQNKQIENGGRANL